LICVIFTATSNPSRWVSARSSPKPSCPQRTRSSGRSPGSRKAGAGTVAITSTHPAAPVFEFGGTIRPKGAPIRIKQAQMTLKAATEQAPVFQRQLEAKVERLLARHNL
jgi:hypothetical protein